MKSPLHVVWWWIDDVSLTGRAAAVRRRLSITNVETPAALAKLISASELLTDRLFVAVRSMLRNR